LGNAGRDIYFKRDFKINALRIDSATHRLKNLFKDSMLKHQLFPAIGTPRFNMVIVHGMAEHAARYTEFAEYLSQLGGNIITFDLRGHGQYRQRGQVLGDFGHLSFGGAQQIFKDIEKLYASVNNGLPNILLGHSFGSAVALRYAQTHDHIAQIILTGTPANPLWLFNLCYHIANIEAKVRGSKPSIFNNTFVEYNKHYIPTTTPHDWISANADNVQNYTQDPNCGQPFSPSGFAELFNIMRQTFNPKALEQIDKRTSVLMLWGDDDPVTQFGRATTTLCDQLRALGLSVAQIEYPDLRHEILNETNRMDVWGDIARFIQA
jgi:alpha-beta hydrolase superfamily lysophospholipase